MLYKRKVRTGLMAITYIGLYAITQLIVFQFRKSEPAVLLGLRQAQWTAIGMLVIGVPGLYLLWRRTADRAEAFQLRGKTEPAPVATTS
jgi:prolipoprotein diacylglyceryltransferase